MLNWKLDLFLLSSFYHYIQYFAYWNFRDLEWRSLLIEKRRKGIWWANKVHRGAPWFKNNRTLWKALQSPDESLEWKLCTGVWLPNWLGMYIYVHWFCFWHGSLYLKSSNFCTMHWQSLKYTLLNFQKYAEIFFAITNKKY